MPHGTMTGAWSEPQFAAHVDALAADPAQRAQLTELLREAHPVYDQRGTATIVRMRGWLLLALARTGLSAAALPFVLEELDTGVDAYLVAAAARALRASPRPTETFAPFVLRALTTMRAHDEPLSFAQYGEYAVAATDTSPVRELLATLAWLGPHARGVLPEVEALRAPEGGLPRKWGREVAQAVAAIQGAGQGEPRSPKPCCHGALGTAVSWGLEARRGCEPIEALVFEDHAGAALTFTEFFRGHPSIVVFFYTRCDNPLKCSLTVTKLARVQQVLEDRGLAEQIHTAAITYDPAFDLPHRLRNYGQNRGVRLDARHRLLRTPAGLDTLRRHFQLGVNFVESLVNRHRVELYILDAEGRIAEAFTRTHWDERHVVERTCALLKERRGDVT